MIRSELDAAGVHDPALRDAYRRCRAAQRRARPHVLPRHPAAGARSSGPRSTRCTGSPAAPTTSSTTSTGPPAPRERAERLQLLATQLFNQLVQQQDCGDDPDAARPWCTPPAGTAFRGRLFDDFLARCGWI